MEFTREFIEEIVENGVTVRTFIAMFNGSPIVIHKNALPPNAPPRSDRIVYETALGYVTKIEWR